VREGEIQDFEKEKVHPALCYEIHCPTLQYFQDSVLIFPEILNVILKATEVFLQ
jgi:hypothetical protein